MSAIGVALGVVAGCALLVAPPASAQTGGPPPSVKLAPGLAATVFASGLRPGLPGPANIAFGANGDVFVTDITAGAVFRFGRNGGAADLAHPLAANINFPAGVAVSKDGRHLFVAERQNFDIIELSPVDGRRVRVVAAGLPCPSGLAADPRSGDLFFTTSGCAQQAGPDRLMRVADPLGRATVSTFATVIGAGRGFSFGPDGALYMEGAVANGNHGLVKVDGPSSASPGTVHPIVDMQFAAGVVAAAGARDGQAPVLVANRTDGRLVKVDLTATPPTIADLFTGGSGVGAEALGPDQCVYVPQDTTVLRITNTDGSCPLRLAAAVSGAHHRSSFSAGVVAITSISTKAKDLVRSAGLGALLLLLVGFPAQLFNNTLAENYDDVRRWFGPFTRAADSVAGGLARVPGWLGFGLFAAVAALLTGLLDPHFGADEASAVLFVGLFVSFVFVTVGFGWPERRYVLGRHGDRGRLRVRPGSIVVAALCVLVSRLAGFSPGYLYGLLAGFVFATELSDRDAGRLTAWSSLLILLASLGAWIVWTPIGHMAAHPHANIAVLVLDTVLSGVFVAGIEGLVFGLVPLRFLEGEKVFGWNRRAWTLLYALGMFTFVHVLLHPGVAYTESPHKNLFVSALVLFGLFGGGSVAFWARFRKRAAVTVGDSGPPASRESIDA